MEDESRTIDRKTIILFTLLALLFLARLVARFFPESRLWGINHLLFTPDPFRHFYAAVGLLLLALFFPRVRRGAAAGFDVVARIFEKKDRVFWGIVAICFGCVFWLFRMPTNLLGDGYTVINNIGDEMPVVFKWSESGAVHLVYFISTLLPVEGLARGEYAYAILSVIAGAMTVFFFFFIAFELGRDRVERLFVFCMLLFSGWLLLFFGYAENYPILWPVLCGYIYFAVAYIRGGGTIFIPLLLLGIGLYLHLQVLAFSASLIVILLARGWGLRQFQARQKIFLVAGGIILLAGASLYIWQYNTSIGFMVHFLPPFFGRGITPDYAVLSLSHIVDIANLSLLLIPVWPALLFISRRQARSLLKDKVSLFLLFFSVGGVVFLLLIDPRLGMGRDWDLFALCLLGPALVLIRMTLLACSDKSTFVVLSLMALLLTAPYIYTNTGRVSSQVYIKSLLELDRARSRSGLVMVRDYLYRQGNVPGAVAVNNKLIEYFPQKYIADSVSVLIEKGQNDVALILADSIFRMNPYVVDGYNMKGMVFLRLNRLDSALYYLTTSLELGRYEHKTYVNLAEYYSRLGNNDLMWKNLRHAQKLSPNSYTVLMPMAMSFYVDGLYDSALVYGKILVRDFSDREEGYLILGLSLISKRDYPNAKPFLERYLEIAQPSGQREIAAKTLEELNRRLEQEK